MPKTQNEDDKKHGDKLGPLIDRTVGGSKAKDEDEDEDVEPTELQDDDDEDVENDDRDDRRDVGRTE